VELFDSDGFPLSSQLVDIRLYDGLGNLLRQATATGGKIEFNVANLPNGIYYLHIYDGVNEKPEMRQIVVQH
ncbi:MAG: T9SS type A sorting domain-containing protein, partial [Candidatus Azobacteroides sp.]|nr:T9SS type A sorting domain-containing protein [Candidatus Azobacteroides sp.]